MPAEQEGEAFDPGAPAPRLRLGVRYGLLWAGLVLLILVADGTIPVWVALLVATSVAAMVAIVRFQGRPGNVR